MFNAPIVLGSGAPCHAAPCNRGDFSPPAGREYDPDVPAYVWLSLLVFVVAIVAAGVLAGRRGLAAWRAFTRFQAVTDYALLELDQRVAGVETRLAAVDRTSARLTDAQARLAESVATAAVLASALAEARAFLGAVRSVYPVK